MTCARWFLVGALGVFGCGGATSEPATATTPVAAASTSRLPSEAVHATLGGVEVATGAVELNLGSAGLTFAFRAAPTEVSVTFPDAPTSEQGVYDVSMGSGSGMYMDSTGANVGMNATYVGSLELDEALPACAPGAEAWSSAGRVSGRVLLRIQNESGESIVQGAFSANVVCPAS